MKETLEVKGMSCVNCQATVKETLENLKGMEEVSVDLSSGKVNVAFDETVIVLNEIKKAIKEQGYDVV